jgi:ABC-type polysaccharide/polyol phosphate export permease
MNKTQAYWQYVIFSSQTALRSRVAGSYLGYLWWFLDPLLLMLVYILVFDIILQRGKPNFPVFLFAGLLPWKWFSGVLLQSTGSIRGRMNIIEQIAIPKYIFPLIELVVQSFLLLIGFFLILIMMIFFKLPWTLHLLELFFVLGVNSLLLYGLALFTSHWGVFFIDIKNILNIIVRLWFYLTPVFYDLANLPERLRFYWWCNPMTTMIESYRNIFIYGRSPYYSQLLIWLGISLLLIISGISLQEKYSNQYAKVK